MLEKVSGPEVDALQRIGDDYRHEYSDLLGADVPNSFDGKIRVMDSEFSSHMMVGDQPRLYEVDGKWFLRSNQTESGGLVDGYGQKTSHAVGLLAMSVEPGEKHKLYIDFRGLSQAHWFSDEDSLGSRKTGLRRVIGHEVAHAYSIGRLDTNEDRMRVIETDLGFEEGLVEVFAAMGALDVSKRQGALGDFEFNAVKDYIDEMTGIGPDANLRKTSPYKAKIQFLEFARFLSKADTEPFYRTLMNASPLQRKEALLRIIDISGKQKGLSDDEILRNKRMISKLVDGGFMSGANISNNYPRHSLWDDVKQEWRISSIDSIVDDLRDFGITERYQQILRSYV